MMEELTARVFCDRGRLLNFYHDHVLHSFSSYTGDMDLGCIHEQLVSSYIIQSLNKQEFDIGLHYAEHWHDALPIRDLYDFIEYCVRTLYDIGGSLDCAPNSSSE